MRRLDLACPLTIAALRDAIEHVREYGPFDLPVFARMFGLPFREAQTWGSELRHLCRQLLEHGIEVNPLVDAIRFEGEALERFVAENVESDAAGVLGYGTAEELVAAEAVEVLRIASDAPTDVRQRLARRARLLVDRIDDATARESLERDLADVAPLKDLPRAPRIAWKGDTDESKWYPLAKKPDAARAELRAALLKIQETRMDEPTPTLEPAPEPATRRRDRSEKTSCPDCGAVISKASMWQHKKTKHGPKPSTPTAATDPLTRLREALAALPEDARRPALELLLVLEP